MTPFGSFGFESGAAELEPPPGSPKKRKRRPFGEPPLDGEGGEEELEEESELEEGSESELEFLEPGTEQQEILEEPPTPFAGEESPREEAAEHQMMGMGTGGGPESSFSESPTLVHKLSTSQAACFGPEVRCSNCQYLGESGTDCKVTEHTFDDPTQAGCVGAFLERGSAEDLIGGDAGGLGGGGYAG